MRYIREQRLDIGRQIYDNEITKAQAVELYKISDQTARGFMRPEQMAGRRSPMFPQSEA